MKEVHSLEQYLYKHVNTQRELPVYSPEEFYKICQKAKAANVYNLILECMSSNRHSKEGTEVNMHRVVSILYQMCYGLSQKCDFFQQDNGLFLKFSHLTDEGLETQRNLGTSICLHKSICFQCYSGRRNQESKTSYSFYWWLHQSPHNAQAQVTTCALLPSKFLTLLQFLWQIQFLLCTTQLF